MATHIVIGLGECSAEAVTASLNDVIKEGDSIALAWAGKDIPGSVQAVYKYVFDKEMDFTVYYTEGQTVHSSVRDRQGTVMKVKDPLSHMVENLTGKVLVLWDDDIEDALHYVFDHAPTATVLELSNGLCPISGVVEEPSDEVVEDEEDDEPVTPMTREELESATAFVVKRYGQRMGCKSNTKASIIVELFPEGEVEETVEEVAIIEETKEPAPDKVFPAMNAVLTLVDDFYSQRPTGFAAEMAYVKIAEARVWMLRALSGGES